ncbi:hypothetical protein CIB48_g11026 [Xylaria polymorpha]|nr:hypothetical protein CIB48_g11026 [Xylaria polymorpha]
MAPTIHIIRHAQALNNLPNNIDGMNIRDPKLTEQGYQQCQILATELAVLGYIEMVFASPLQRSIQTALAAFETYTQSKRITLLAHLQEVGQIPSNTGDSPDDLANQYGHQRLDYRYIPYDWNDQSPYSRFAPCYTGVRAQSTRNMLRVLCARYAATNVNICVVTHAMYIRHLVPADGDVFQNAEWRSYQFNQVEGSDTQPNLIETPWSIARRQRAKDALSLPLSSIFRSNPPGLWAPERRLMDNFHIAAAILDHKRRGDRPAIAREACSNNTPGGIATLPSRPAAAVHGTTPSWVDPPRTSETDHVHDMIDDSRPREEESSRSNLALETKPEQSVRSSSPTPRSCPSTPALKVSASDPSNPAD